MGRGPIMAGPAPAIQGRFAAGPGWAVKSADDTEDGGHHRARLYPADRSSVVARFRRFVSSGFVADLCHA